MSVFAVYKIREETAPVWRCQALGFNNIATVIFLTLNFFLNNEGNFFCPLSKKSLLAVVHKVTCKQKEFPRKGKQMEQPIISTFLTRSMKPYVSSLGQLKNLTDRSRLPEIPSVALCLDRESRIGKSSQRLLLSMAACSRSVQDYCRCWCSVTLAFHISLTKPDLQTTKIAVRLNMASV
jgi:hypothetical protein